MNSKTNFNNLIVILFLTLAPIVVVKNVVNDKQYIIVNVFMYFIIVIVFGVMAVVVANIIDKNELHSSSGLDVNEDLTPIIMLL